jgi:hypothetical protein
VILLDVVINKKGRFESIKDFLFHEKESPEVFVLSIVSNNNITNTVFKNYKLAYFEFTYKLDDYNAKIYFNSDSSKKAISNDGTKIQLQKTALIGG